LRQTFHAQSTRITPSRIYWLIRYDNEILITAKHTRI
jgi:hypothetical protein